MTEAELARWKETTDMFVDMEAHSKRAFGTFLDEDYKTTVAHLQAGQHAAYMLWMRILKESGQ